jgi:hypothetical protein
MLDLIPADQLFELFPLGKRVVTRDLSYVDGKLQRVYSTVMHRFISSNGRPIVVLKTEYNGRFRGSYYAYPELLTEGI